MYDKNTTLPPTNLGYGNGKNGCSLALPLVNKSGKAPPPCRRNAALDNAPSRIKSVNYSRGQDTATRQRRGRCPLANEHEFIPPEPKLCNLLTMALLLSLFGHGGRLSECSTCRLRVLQWSTARRNLYNPRQYPIKPY